MTKRTSIVDNLTQKFLANPKNLSYGSGKMAIRWKTTPDLIKEAREKARNILKGAEYSLEIVPQNDVMISKSEDRSTSTLKLEGLSNNEPKTIEEIEKIFKIDTKEFTIQRYWTGFNGKQWKTTVDVKRNHIDTSVTLQADTILKEIKKYSPVVKSIAYTKSKERKHLLELSTAELHIGKLAHRDEVGEDYDVKIAEERFKKSVGVLLSRVDLDTVKKVLFVVGNDFINVDNYNSTTTAGTPQSTDSRFHKMIDVAKRVVIDTVDRLLSIAPVDIVVVQGNHDRQTTFLLGHIVEAFYHNNINVTVNNQPSQRKYYQYGANSIQLTHGNEEKHTELGLIFATEQPRLWADTKFRFCQLGHFHKNKTTNYLSVDEHQGFQIQILPSLSSSDCWHRSRGYDSKKQNKAFLFDPCEGLVAEYTYTV